MESVQIKAVKEDTDAQYMRETMDRTVMELRSLQLRATELQHIIGKILAQGALSSDDIEAIQALDHLTQSIEGIADFWQALNMDTPEHWQCNPVKAASHVKLNDLAKALSSDDIDPEAEQHYTEDDCELF
jgi:hypothetical protein